MNGEPLSNPATTEELAGYADVTDRAHAFQREGWEVLVLAPGSKVPFAGTNGLNGAIRDSEAIKRALAEHPDANLGGRLPEGTLAVDVDDLAEWERLVDGRDLPETLTHASGRAGGGLHLVYRYPGGKLSSARLPKGVDLRTRSNYLVLPGSTHPDTGNTYQRQVAAPVADAPQWLLDLLTPPEPAPPKNRPRPTGSTDGPAAQFNARTPISALLLRAGWAVVKGDGDAPGSHWRHPEATSERSASVGEDGRLYVYSPNTPLPASDGPTNGLDAFDVYRYLHHDGDASAAARDLLRAGEVAVTKPETDRRLELERFWEETPALRYVHLLAQARRVGPWALLARVMLQLLCTIPPIVRGDTGIGSPMALNLFVAMVGTTGRGKGLADSVASQYVEVLYGGQPCVVLDRPVGSGEGVVGEFLRNDDDDGPLKPIIFTALEVDTVAALFARTGNTLSAELRKMFMGEQLGQTNASKHTNRMLSQHSYRAGLVVGVQPEQSAALLNAVAGGFPGRFVWLPVDDPTAPEVAPATPPKLRVDVPPFIRVAYLSVPETARAAMDAHRLDGLHGESIDPLDAHRLAVQYRVAAGLAMLELAAIDDQAPARDRAQVTEDDWQRAGVVMQMSDLARGQCLLSLAEQKRTAKVARAHDAADHDEIQSGTGAANHQGGAPADAPSGPEGVNPKGVARHPAVDPAGRLRLRR